MSDSQCPCNNPYCQRQQSREEPMREALEDAVRIVARMENEQVSREGQDFLAKARKALRS